jgi:hypothetical protein
VREGYWDYRNTSGGIRKYRDYEIQKYEINPRKRLLSDVM